MIVCDRAQNVTVVEYTFKKNTQKKTPKQKNNSISSRKKREKQLGGEREVFFGSQKS